MISCKRAAELTSKRLDQPLSIGERISLALHLFTCRLCTRYANQLAFLRKAYREFDSTQKSQAGLDDEQKARLVKRLRERGE